MEEENKTIETEEVKEEPQTEKVEDTVEDVAQSSEPKKKDKKKLIIIIVIVSVLLLAGIITAVVLLLKGDKSDNQTTTTTETTTTTTEITIKREGKKLSLYKYVIDYDGIDTTYEGITDEKFNSSGVGVSYTYSPFTISCEYKTCSFVTSTEDNSLIFIKDGNYYSVFTADDKLIAREIAKDLIDKGHKLYPNIMLFNKTVSGDLFIGFNEGEEFGEKILLYNITKNIHSDIIKDSDLYCGDGVSGCAMDIIKYTDYYPIATSGYDNLRPYNIVENKFEDFTIPYDTFVIGNKDKAYLATQYYRYGDNFQDGTIMDFKGKVIKNNLNYVGSYDNIIYIQTNDNLQKLDINLNHQKQISNVTKTYMNGKGFVLANINGKLKLFDNDLNELTTFIEGFDENRYEVHTMLSGWFTDQGKNGIYIVIEDSELTTDDDDMAQGYEFYYIPATGESGKIETEIGGYAKPVLYLYPTKETNVKVTFDKPEMLTTTYPKYIDSWNVKVKPNGDMYDKDGKYYYALYWEEKKNHQVSFNEGFYVTKDNAISFLEDKLTTIGLNAKEKNEFIMYWLPILEKNSKSLVYFELTEERNSNSPINIEPKPDSLLRVAIHVKKVDTKINIKEQKLTTFKRTGFVAVEWGGVIY